MRRREGKGGKKDFLLEQKIQVKDSARTNLGIVDAHKSTRHTK